MSRIFVAGLTNIETTLQVDGFPIDYTPATYAFFGVNSSVSAVGYNVALALTALGSQVRLATIVGRDILGAMVLQTLDAAGIDCAYVQRQMEQTAQSVIMFDPAGRRRISTDLKDIQQQVYPPAQALAGLDGCDLAVLCNINFARPLLAEARARGIPIATDLHVLTSLDDAYSQDWLRSAAIIFQSGEQLPCSPEDWAAQIMARFSPQIVVIGLGDAGSLLALRDREQMRRVPAVYTRPVVNTVGAGDALFAAFVHFYSLLGDAEAALKRATVFASYKIGSTGGAEGYLGRADFEQVWRLHAD
jgi:ribokinase